MTTDTFLFNAGWLFFAAWIAVVAAVSVTAFGRDLLVWRTHSEPIHQPLPAEHITSTQSNTH
jgi:hypothetical protein